MASPNDTIITLAMGGTLVDSSGNQWTITSGGQAAENGVTDTGTNQVVEMAYVNGLVWQESAAGLWWAKTGGPGNYDGWTSGPGADNSAGTLTSPLPSGTLTWVGGGNNSASNPLDWSPTRLPQAGDTLIMTSGTIDIANNLAGDTLGVQSVTIDLESGADVDLAPASESSGIPPMAGTVNAIGDSTLNLVGVFQSLNLVVVAAGVNLTVTGTASGAYGGSISGPGTLINNGTLSVDGDISANVTGQGVIDISHYHDASSVTSDVSGSIGPGQTLDITPGYAATVIIDQPLSFAGTIVNADTNAIITLDGLTATSYTITNDLLTLYNGATVRNSLRIQNQTTAASDVYQTNAGVVVSYGDSVNGVVLPIYSPALPQPPSGVLPLGPPNNFLVSDQTTGGSWQAQGQPYVGPVMGLTSDIIIATSDNINVTAEIPNVFIKTGSGEDAIDVSKVNGSNIMDGSTGSNFLTGGTGLDTFYVDDRNAAQPIWSTLVNFHSGDNATIWGITANDFQLSWADNEGAANAKGLTGTFTGAGTSTAVITLAGLTTANLTNGSLSISYGKTADLPNLPGSDYMLIHAN